MAADEGTYERALWIARLCLVASVLLGILALAQAIAAWPRLPESVPTHFDAAGRPDDWSERSGASVFLLPILALGMGPGIALMGLMAVGASHRPPPDRLGLRAAMPPLAIFMGVLGLLCTVLLAGISVGGIRVALGQASSLGWLPLVGGVGVGVWALAGAAYFLTKHSTFGKGDGPEADPTRWKWGAFYVAPQDPSLFVEKRFGGGYTINFGLAAGRRIAWGMGLFFAALLGLLAWLILAS